MSQNLHNPSHAHADGQAYDPHAPGVHSPRQNAEGPPGGAHHHPSVRLYLVIWLILMVLLVLTVAVAAVHIPFIGFLIAMAIAITKALLVVLYFMHVRYSSPIVWVFSGAAFLWFAIMIGLTIQDYVTRGWYMWQ